MTVTKGTKSPKNLVLVKITKKTKDIRCPKDKSQVMVDGSGYYEVPLGFGFRGTKFVVDKVRLLGWWGECMGKSHHKVFAWHTKKVVTKTPRGINAKIKAKRG